MFAIQMQRATETRFSHLKWRIKGGESKYHEHISIKVMTFAGNDIDKRDKRTQKHRSSKIRDDNENW